MMAWLWLVAAAPLLALCGLVGFTAWTARRVERALPPRGRFVEAGGARFHYVERGSGPPILMIHGLGGQMGNFTYALTGRLSDAFRVIAIDRPGSAYSTRPAGAAANLRAQAQAIAALITALGLQRPLVVGHSLGGGVALALALDFPEQVGGLALIAPLTAPEAEPPAPFRGLNISSPALRVLIAWTFAVPVSILWAAKTVGAAFAPEPTPADFAVEGGGLLALRPSHFIAACTDMAAANADLPQMQARYPSLRIPVAVLYGLQDRILAAGRQGVPLQGRIEDLRLELVSGGHMLPVSQPDLTADFIRRAARRVRPG